MALHPTQLPPTDIPPAGYIWRILLTAAILLSLAGPGAALWQRLIILP